MLELGQTVLYGTEGVCRVSGIEEMKIGGKRASYYVLSPVFQGSATIYVPVDNPVLTAKMRRILSAEEIDKILATATEEDLTWIEDPNERKTEYGRILSSGDRCEVVRLIRMLYLRRSQLQKSGKHLRMGDEQLLRDAEKLLNDEFAHVLQISRQEVPDYIRSRIGESA